MLNQTQVERYSRQIVIPEIGRDGQELLLRSCVAVVGTNGLARMAALYLAAAGIGKVDLYSHATEPEGARLQRDLTALNPDVTSRIARLPSDPTPGSKWAEDYDVLVETTGNEGILRIVNTAAVALRIPLLAGHKAFKEGAIK